MEPVARVTVTVTFLRMDRAPAASSPGLPTDYQVVVVQSPTVAFYRYLYDTVGAGYVWWLRRTMPDDELAMLLRDPRVSIYACCTAAASRPGSSSWTAAAGLT